MQPDYNRRPLISAGTLLGIGMGGCLFNLVEGIIDHHLLHIHHVTEAINHLVWDFTFLGAGMGLILNGSLAHFVC